MYLYQLNGDIAISTFLPKNIQNDEYIYVDKIESRPGKLRLDLQNKKYYYVDEIKPPDSLPYDILNLVNKKIDAITERSDFIEDCIAEMAGVVYNTEETT